MEELLAALLDTDVVDAGIGAAAIAIAWLLRKLPAKVLAPIKKLIDKTDSELEK